MTAQDLKNSILQRAIEGKLVPQRKEEGTARELLAEIRAEKARLVKEKKIKKSKPLPEITDDEKPFDIPDSWEWVRLKDLGQFSSGKTPSKQVPSNWANGTINWFTSKDIKSDYLSKSQILISEKATKELQLYPAGTLLMVVRSGILKRLFPVSLLKAPGTINQDIKAFQIYDERISMYLFICLKGLSPYILKQFRKQVTTVDSLRFEDFSIMPIPMPPLAEQQRILERVEELQPDIDAYDKAQTELAAIEERFPDDMKKSLLQYAIEGKLVPQRKEEGTAKELLAEIRAEKARLIKEKKIKKTKPLPAITDNEKPFAIPASWEWVKLGNIGTLVRGSGIKRNETTPQGRPCVRYGELYTTYHTRFSSTVSYTSKEVFDKSKKVHQNDILMSLTGENKWDIALAVVYEGETEIAMGGDMTKWEYHGMDPLYLAMILNSPYGISCKRNMATGDIIVHISNNKLSEIALPIPPLAEQHRIVARLEELLPLCEQLAVAP